MESPKKVYMRDKPANARRKVAKEMHRGLVIHPINRILTYQLSVQPCFRFSHGESVQDSKVHKRRNVIVSLASVFSNSLDESSNRKRYVLFEGQLIPRFTFCPASFLHLHLHLHHLLFSVCRYFFSLNAPRHLSRGLLSAFSLT